MCGLAETPLGALWARGVVEVGQGSRCCLAAAAAALETAGCAAADLSINKVWSVSEENNSGRPGGEGMVLLLVAMLPRFYYHFEERMAG